MFTGLIAEKGKILTCQESGGIVRLRILAPGLAREGLRPGDSVSTHGICLTATQVLADAFEVEAMPETWAKTTLRSWQAGDDVNLERAVRAQDRLDGHLVMGHVDGIAVVRDLQRPGASWRVQCAAPAECSALLAVQGSVALDGVSLTIAELSPPNDFWVALVPFTLEHTTLRGLRVGSRLNLETDILARYLQRIVGAERKAGLSRSDLDVAGF